MAPSKFEAKAAERSSAFAKDVEKMIPAKKTGSVNSAEGRRSFQKPVRPENISTGRK